MKFAALLERLVEVAQNTEGIAEVSVGATEAVASYPHVNISADGMKSENETMQLGSAGRRHEMSFAVQVFFHVAKAAEVAEGEEAPPDEELLNAQVADRLLANIADTELFDAGAVDTPLIETAQWGYQDLERAKTRTLRAIVSIQT